MPTGSQFLLYRVHVGLSHVGAEDRAPWTQHLSGALIAPFSDFMHPVCSNGHGAREVWEFSLPLDQPGSEPLCELSRLLSRGGAFCELWRGRHVSVPVSLKYAPMPPGSIQLVFTGVPSELSVVGLPEAVLELAGYSVVLPCGDSAIARPGSGSVLLLRYRLGFMPGGVYYDGGRFVVDVLPPSDDPWLSRLPPRLQLYGFYFCTLVTGDPLPRVCAPRSAHMPPPGVPAAAPPSALGGSGAAGDDGVFVAAAAPMATSSGATSPDEPGSSSGGAVGGLTSARGATGDEDNTLPVVTTSLVPGSGATHNYGLGVTASSREVPSHAHSYVHGGLGPSDENVPDAGRIAAPVVGVLPCHAQSASASAHGAAGHDNDGPPAVSTPLPPSASAHGPAGDDDNTPLVVSTPLVPGSGATHNYEPGVTASSREVPSHAHSYVHGGLGPSDENVPDAGRVAVPIVGALPTHAQLPQHSIGPGDEDICSICRDPLGGAGRRLVLTPCSHSFHAVCLDAWLHRHNGTTCPLCRFVLRDPRAPPDPPDAETGPAHATAAMDAISDDDDEVVLPLPPPMLLSSAEVTEREMATHVGRGDRSHWWRRRGHLIGMAHVLPQPAPVDGSAVLRQSLLPRWRPPRATSLPDPQLPSQPPLRAAWATAMAVADASATAGDSATATATATAGASATTTASATAWTSASAPAAAQLQPQPQLQPLLQPQLQPQLQLLNAQLQSEARQSGRTTGTPAPRSRKRPAVEPRPRAAKRVRRMATGAADRPAAARRSLRVHRPPSAYWLPPATTGEPMAMDDIIDMPQAPDTPLSGPRNRRRLVRASARPQLAADGVPEP